MKSDDMHHVVYRYVLYDTTLKSVFAVHAHVLSKAGAQCDVSL